MSGSTARTELVGQDLSLETGTWDTDDPWAPPRPGFVGRLHLGGHETDITDPLPVTFVVDGRPAAPEVLWHEWEPDLVTTQYALTDALRVTERKGVRGRVLCADWQFEGAGTVEIRADVPRSITARVTTISLYADLAAEIPVTATPLEPVQAPATVRFRCGLGAEPAGDVDARPFRDWLATNAPRLQTDDAELAAVYEYRWFVVYRNLHRPDRWFAEHPMPGELFFEGPITNWFTAPIGLSLPLQIREARWLREPHGVQDTLDAWTRNAGALRSYASDPISPALEFAEHHPLRLDEALRAAHGYVRGRGRSERIAGGGPDAFPLTVGSWVTGTEYAPDFFAEAGWDHTRSERFLDVLPRAGAPARLTSIHRVDTDVWHWRLNLATGGPDLRDELVRLHLHDGLFRSVGGAPITNVLNFEAAIPFLYDDFTPAARRALVDALDRWSAPAGLYSTAPDCPAFSADNTFDGYAYPCCWNGPVWNYATSWVLHALGAVATRTRDGELRERFEREWAMWTESHLRLGLPLVVEHFHPETGRPYRLIPDYFHSAWLDTFFRHVVLEPLVKIPLRVEGIPFRGAEISVERSGAPG